ncbi:hypothetical protein EJ05DRAFT_498995 [Pseudovirgaria hyperparasitica]|uniref:Uncharacterized protein n=1 Tax=Pseudovirgaria hyperparasitica TaxID=470096 RepID=A0A6A6WFB2_9PEZI|nr:uncharacterized protein EJ05DRAFT_498995 [Pseudovirgaria hyperparasitica]KAF2759801.1 hypothetical protein EJ05DRAFT_498995 [Pseudovirgaria hyperparasitica]
MSAKNTTSRTASQPSAHRELTTLPSSERPRCYLLIVFSISSPRPDANNDGLSASGADERKRPPTSIYKLEQLIRNNACALMNMVYWKTPEAKRITLLEGYLITSPASLTLESLSDLVKSFDVGSKNKNKNKNKNKTDHTNTPSSYPSTTAAIR